MERAISSFCTKFPLLEKLFLCTCNRSLLIVICDSDNLKKTKQKLITLLQGWAKMRIPRQYIHSYSGSRALEKLVYIAVGMESPIFGEDQILGQIRLFYKLALKKKTTGPVLNRIIQQLLYTAKKIKRKTSLSQRRLSLPGLVAEEIESFALKTNKNKLKILLVGRGDIIYTIFRIIKTMKCIEKIDATNRTLSKINMPCKKIKINKIKVLSKNYDIIISMTSKPTHIINFSHLNNLTKNILLIDLGVPRNINPNLTKIPLVKIIDIDILNRKANKNLEKRKRQIPQTKTHVYKFRDKMAEFIKNYNRQCSVNKIIEQIKLATVCGWEPFLKILNPKKKKLIVNSFCKKIYRAIAHQNKYAPCRLVGPGR